MPKKREKPVINPINRNLVSALASTPPSPRSEITETPLVLPPPPPPSSKDKVEAANTPLPSSGKKRAAKSTNKLRVREGGERKVAVQRTRFNLREIEENTAFTQFMEELVGSKVSESDITRALWSLARRSEDELRSIREKAPQIERPAYADRLGSAAYEDAIAAFLHRALKLAKVEE